MHRSKIVLALLAAVAMAQPAVAQRDPGLQPSEDVWQPADTPEGGISWATLESAEEIQREEYGLVYSRPDFPSAVKALEGKKIKVNGYMLPLQNGTRQSHFVLLAYPPDCPFHLNPAPDQFIEVRAGTPMSVENGVVTIEGTLVLSGEDESGIFYQMTNARAVG